MSPSAPIPIALTIAGSDSSGGAGMQADLKTFAALGVYGASVLAALTAQNTQQVTAICDIEPGFVLAQLDAVFSDLRIDAIKIGMLSQAAVIDVVVDALHEQKRTKGGSGVPVVLDPVMVAKSGAVLLSPTAITALRDRLVPLATVLTPNLPEAAVLLGCSEAEVHADAAAACRRLHALGARAVVLKGGHRGGAASDDLLYDGQQLLELPSARHPTTNTHGTGCTFSAAIAAALAHGLALQTAVRAAKRYISAAIAAADQLAVGHGPGPGPGHGPVHHFFALWPQPARTLLDPKPEI